MGKLYALILGIVLGGHGLVGLFIEGDRLMGILNVDTLVDVIYLVSALLLFLVAFTKSSPLMIRVSRCGTDIGGEPTAAQAQGASITTIEGLSQDGTLHPMQAAFRECHGLQCGYCTPGMVMSAVQLLADNPKASEAEIRAGLEGNICRCTGYEPIIEAVLAASRGRARA